MEKESEEVIIRKKKKTKLLLELERNVDENVNMCIRGCLYLYIERELDWNRDKES